MNYDTIIDRKGDVRQYVIKSNKDYKNVLDELAADANSLQDTEVAIAFNGNVCLWIFVGNAEAVCNSIERGCFHCVAACDVCNDTIEMNVALTSDAADYHDISLFHKFGDLTEKQWEILGM